MRPRERTGHPMQRSDVVLAAMATCRRGTLFEPVRIQKLLFLIDREIPDAVDGPHFRFRPYHYGPFDRMVFVTLEELGAAGQVAIDAAGALRTYSLTTDGLARGSELLLRLPADVREYLTKLARWVLSLRFARLLAAIYHEYPDMATESVALDTTRRCPRQPLEIPRNPFLAGAASVFDLSSIFDTPRPLTAREPHIMSDADAMRDTWEAVGDDMYAALADFATEQPMSDPDL